MNSVVSRLTSHARLHLGLFDLGYATSRQNGGIGAAISRPATTVQFWPAPNFDIVGIKDLTEPEKDKLVSGVDSLLKLMGRRPKAKFEIVRDSSNSHVGLGSKTSLMLSILQAVAIASDYAITPDQLQQLSGRGGTSGIGIHAFFGGGLMLDGGRAESKNKIRNFVPSSQAGKLPTVPPLLGCLPVSDSWNVDLYLPNGQSLSGPAELELFRAHTPLPDLEVSRSIVHAYELLAFAKEGNLEGFGEALTYLQSVGFKSREFDAQPVEVQRFLTELREIEGVAAGMSSVGPLMFVITDSNSDLPSAKEAAELARNYGAQSLGTFKVRAPERGYDLALGPNDRFDVEPMGL